jgi:serine phosphatase RsbU (regulator of sigma subunit)
MPIGIHVTEITPFTNHKIDVRKGDQVYLFSDGYADQFGGENGKKFMYKQFQELLTSISGLPMDKQKEKLDAAFDKWRGEYEQIDDVLVIGFKIR